MGSFSLEDNCQLVQRTAFYPVCSLQKKFHICPCSLLYIRRFDFKFQNGMLGSHSYGKSPVTSSNKSNQSRQVFCHAQVGCCIRLEQQCFILRRQAFFHISVGCCICRLELNKLFQIKPILCRRICFYLSVDCRVIIYGSSSSSRSSHNSRQLIQVD